MIPIEGENILQDPAEQAKQILAQLATISENMGRQWKLMFDGLTKAGFSEYQALYLLGNFILGTVKK
jgi:hypothetical protein